MIKFKLQFQKLTVIVSIFLASSLSAVAASECAKSVQRFLNHVGVETPIKRFPHGVNGTLHPNFLIQFGFESEYTMKDLGKMVNVYGPSEEFGITVADWLAKPVEARVKWVTDNITKLFPTNREAGKFVKVTNDPKLAFMPGQLIRDETGNIEIVLKPVDTLEDFFREISLVNEHLGVGSMQASVSAPSEVFHGNFEGRVDAAILENVGFFKFHTDLDTLNKLEVGAVRERNDPTKYAAMSFQHPFLGPMTKIKEDKLVEFLTRNPRGELLDSETLKGVAGNDDSFKYYGGTAYRPDIAPKRAILETRDCHTSIECITERVMRTTFHLQNGREQFAQAASFEPFDSIADYAKLPESVRLMLEKFFPAKTKAGVEYTESETRALEVYRNFAWPLRDWSSHIKIFGDLSLKEKVANAQTIYLEDLKNTLDAVESGRFDKEHALLEIQGDLALFSHESGLLKAMRAFESKTLFADPAWNSYARIAVRETGAFKTAFPASILQGSLESRLSILAKQWPANIRVVDGVSFSEVPLEEKIVRKVVMISSQGLSDDQKIRIARDYTDAISVGTVSFPLQEGGATHLLTRVGDQVLNFFRGVNAIPFRVPSRNLEAIVALRPEEELRLRFYLERAMKDDTQVIGDFKAAGAWDALTPGEPRNNRALNAEGRNCASWICTAPIGSNHQGLHSLVGLKGESAERAVTSPAEWSQYLTSQAPAVRVPYVVYWTEASLDETPLRSGESFPAWNFTKH